jgi:phosphomannomutase
MTDQRQLIQTAQDWLAQDFDPKTIAELSDLIAKSNVDQSALAELAEKFSGPLKFGTAGLRAEVAAGQSKMNRATVAQAAWGVASWLVSIGGKSLVVGNDARTGSNDFAIDSCKIASTFGLSVTRLNSPVPTPVLAFGLKELNADAAIMVTASHNPAKDNGYKVYDKTGSQIISPTDVEIAALISKAPKANQINRSGNFQSMDMIDRYVDYVSSHSLPELNKKIKVAYTALHGVGSITFNKLMNRCGYEEIFEVAEQRHPDPTFPTVNFPNPEEPGAMDLLLETASKSNAEIAIANDPDADRTAISIPISTGWKVLSGDELGTLLAWWVIERKKIKGESLSGAMAASIVSSSMIKRIAQGNGLDFSFTLTGFKWVSRVPNLIFGYEEAIGYAVLPEKIRDKDGISAALFAVEMVSYLAGMNKTALDKLEELYQEYGLVLTRQITLRLNSIDEVNAKLAYIIDNLPKYLGKTVLEKIENFADGIDSLPKSSGIRMVFSNGRVIIRPSGTEPKLKCYLEVHSDPNPDATTQKEILNQQLVELSDGLTELFNG